LGGGGVWGGVGGRGWGEGGGGGGLPCGKKGSTEKKNHFAL